MDRLEEEEEDEEEEEVKEEEAAIEDMVEPPSCDWALYPPLADSSPRDPSKLSKEKREDAVVVEEHGEEVEEEGETEGEFLASRRRFSSANDEAGLTSGTGVEETTMTSGGGLEGLLWRRDRRFGSPNVVIAGRENSWDAAAAEEGVPTPPVVGTSATRWKRTGAEEKAPWMETVSTGSSDDGGPEWRPVSARVGDGGSFAPSFRGVSSSW